MILTGFLDVMNRKLVLLKRNVLLSSNARVFLLFSTSKHPHALHHDLLYHLTLFYNSLRFLLCCKLPPLRHLGSTCKKNTWAGSSARCAGTGSTPPCKNWFHFAIKSECKFLLWPRAATYIVFHSSLKTYFISVYQHFAFYRVATVREKSGKNKNFSRSGKSQGKSQFLWKSVKSQGILFSGWRKVLWRLWKHFHSEN